MDPTTPGKFGSGAYPLFDNLPLISYKRWDHPLKNRIYNPWFIPFNPDIVKWGIETQLTNSNKWITWDT